MRGRDSKNGGYFKAAAFVTDYLKLNNIKPFYPEYRDSLVTDNLVSYNLVGQLGDYDPKRKTGFNWSAFRSYWHSWKRG
jgi:hypothetical protein